MPFNGAATTRDGGSVRVSLRPARPDANPASPLGSESIGAVPGSLDPRSQPTVMTQKPVPAARRFVLNLSGPFPPGDSSA